MRDFIRIPRDRANDVIKPQNEIWYKGYCKKDDVDYYFTYQNIDGCIINEREIKSKEYNN